jgi:predicted deacylase
VHFAPVTVADAQTIRTWIAADPHHAGQHEAFYLEGSVAATKLEDEQGTVLFLRMDKEKEATRLHVQFAPAGIVSRLRVAKALVRSIPVVCKELGALVAESQSLALVKFLERMGFVRVDGTDDYRLEGCSYANALPSVPATGHAGGVCVVGEYVLDTHSLDD